LITPIGQQFQILLQKELKFNRLSIIEVIAALADFITAVFFAWNGSGGMALVLGQLGCAGCRAFCLAVQGWGNWAPSLHFSMRDLKGYVRFGLYQIGERTINYFNSNLDYLVIGRLLGAEPLGYYTLAYNLIIVPVIKINPIITRVAFPVFAKVQHDEARLKKGYLTVVQALSFINFPIFFGLLVTANLLVPVIFGQKWLPSIILVKILCGVGLLRSTGNPVGSLLLAKGHADWGFMWNLMLVATQVPGILMGAHYGGVVGVAVAYLILQMIYFVLNYLVLIRRLLGRCILEYLDSMWHALKYSAIMGLGVLTVGKVMTNQAANLTLSVQIVSGLVIYALLWLLFKREDIAEFKNLVFGR
jgi:O-antigen/teichoic acid export membrane protein